MKKMRILQKPVISLNSRQKSMLNVSSLFKKSAPSPYKSFKSSIAPEIWKKMTPAERNAHKALQAGYIVYKNKIKVIRLSREYPTHFTTVYRKVTDPKDAKALDNPVIITRPIKNRLKRSLQYSWAAHPIYETHAWKQTLSIRGLLMEKYSLKLNRVVKYSNYLFGVFKFPRKANVNKFFTTPDNATENENKQTNKLIYWNLHLPIYHLYVISSDNSVSDVGDYVYVFNKYGSTQISKNTHGSLLILYAGMTSSGPNDNFEEGDILKSNYNYSTLDNAGNILKENAIIHLYYTFIKRDRLASFPAKLTPKVKLPDIAKDESLEKRSYIKHIARLRYRWFYQPKWSQFRLFKKFFKRSIKRYRKINKNRLFINKFRSHFPKLTGFTEAGLLRLWLPFRRNYRQYWATSNAVRRFSQTLLLTPVSLLVFLQLSPSFAASKYIIKSGAVSINGLAVTTFTQFKPGDVMQLNFVIWKSVRHFFDYQKWSNDFRPLQHVSFLQIDWSSLMFMMIRWPRKYELVAPSFLSERWLRYYIRQFPSKIRNFKKITGNWKVYKCIVAKR